MHSRCCCPPTLFQPVLDLLPDGRIPQRLFYDLVQLRAVADAVGPGTVGHVVVDAHGKGIGLLEHHAHLLAQPGGVQVLVENILAFKAYLALDVNAGDQVIHAVEGFEKRGLAAAGGADEGRDLMGWDLHVDIF